MAGKAMLKIAGGSDGSELEGISAEKRPLLTDDGRVPDFFDCWMEEYTAKVAGDDVRKDSGA
jgi:hypothetical protein